MRCEPVVRTASDATLWRTSADFPSALDVFRYCVTAAVTVTVHVTVAGERGPSAWFAHAARLGA